ncbi:MAG: hypothetical protein D6743_18540, partial [Calditrichaeota bacterium]
MKKRKQVSTVAKVVVLLVVCKLCLFVPFAPAQVDTLRIASYNLLNFPSVGGVQRVDDFRIVMRYLKPDVLVVQELESQGGLDLFLNEVMNQTGATYAAAIFIDGPDTDSGLFYRPDRVSIQPVHAIPTDLRNIYQYTLTAAGQEFIIYSVHLKAGSLDGDQQRRLTETTALRREIDSLPAGTNFMVVGDFNMRSSLEAAFSELADSTANAALKLFDPVDQLGLWHNNPVFAVLHTQSTRTTAFGEGATGGLDDRFDLILVSASLLTPGGMDILPATYRAVGNDGNHLNLAVNAGTNGAVPDSVADALHQASDHLPVAADFILANTTSVASRDAAPNGFVLLQNYPNPFNPVTTISFSL